MIPYIIKSFRGGVSDESDKGIQGSFKHGYGLDIHSRDDILVNGSSVVTVDSSTVNDLIQFFVPASDGSMYAFGSTGSIYSISGNAGDPAVNFVYNDENGAIKGAAEWKESDGNNYLYWATNSSVARALMNGSLDVPWAAGVASQDYKTTLDVATWHTMKNAMGQLNIANGNYLASIGYDGSFDIADLNLRPGNLLKCMEERDDYVLIGSERVDGAEEGHIWSWITTATNWVQKKKIPIQGVNSIIDTELKILQGGDDGEIFYSDFANSVPVAVVPGGGKTNPDGVNVLNDLASFGFFGGSYPGIWTYGRRHKNRAHALNYEYRLAATVAGSSVSSIGAISVLNGVLFASWGTTDGSTSDYGVDCVSSTTKVSQAVYEGLEFDGGIPHQTKTVDTIALVLSPLASGTSVSAKFKLDKESSWKYAVLGDNTTTFSASNEVIALFNVGKPGRIIEIGAELNASGSSSPEIHAIISYLSGRSTEYA